MKKEDHRLLLEQAARATMERIRRDREKAPDKLKCLFSYLEDNLFDKNLDINRMRRDCAIRDNSISIFFTAVAGTPPQAYVLERRTETAAALIRDTDLPMWTISNLIGFSQQVLLSRNFKKRYKMTPLAFRLGVKKIITEAGGRPTVGMPSVGELRRAISSGHNSQATLELIMRIQWHRECKSPRSTPPVDREQRKIFIFKKLPIPKETLETIKAEEAWESLKEKSWIEQRIIINERLAFSTPILFHYLIKKSIPEGRNDKKLGVHLAELAAESLGVTEYVTGEELLHLRAKGWIWLGNARRLADDLNGADAAFSIAAAYLEQGNIDSQIRAEYYAMKTLLRLWQRRIEEASVMNRQALSILRAAGEPKDIAASLIIGAYVYQRAGKDEESIAYSKEALDLLSGQAEPYLEFTAALNLASTYIKSGAIKQAQEILPYVHGLKAAAPQTKVNTHLLQWLEGRLSAETGELSMAAQRYEAAQEGFLKIGQNIHAVLVSLDHALLCWKQGRSEKVKEFTLEIIPLLDALQFHDEVSVGLKLLQSAMARGAVTRAVLEELREDLERVRFDI